jgi:hypothetical protein
MGARDAQRNAMHVGAESAQLDGVRQAVRVSDAMKIDALVS